jgi:hypothetical protein
MAGGGARKVRLMHYKKRTQRTLPDGLEQAATKTSGLISTAPSHRGRPSVSTGHSRIALGLARTVLCQCGDSRSRNATRWNESASCARGGAASSCTNSSSLTCVPRVFVRSGGCTTRHRPGRQRPPTKGRNFGTFGTTQFFYGELSAYRCCLRLYRRNVDSHPLGIPSVFHPR